MIKISSDFIGNFKLGDNIVYNFSILNQLYLAQSNDGSQILLKPIIIVIASITEAVLFDLYLRIEHYTSEGVPNITEKILDEIRKKKIDEFSKYIDNAKSKKLLGKNAKIYEQLHNLRKLRNRVHIQNTKNHFEPDEKVAFSKARQTTAEKTLEELMKIMEERYTRKNTSDFVNVFKLPWEEHLEHYEALGIVFD
jgi:hypothetical protein